MYTEPGTNGIAAFLRLSRPINVSPIHIAAAVPLGPVITHHNFPRAAFSTGVIGTGLALSAFYAGILKGDHHVHAETNDTVTPIQWLEYPLNYVPPTMDLFVEDEVPFGVFFSQSCPKDSEHLERAFDLLQYQHLFQKLGVPSVVGQEIIIIRRLRVLGNTSSGSSLDLLPANQLLSAFNSSASSKGGPQETHGGCTGRERNAYDESMTRSMNSTLTLLPPVSGDEQPLFDRTGIRTASIFIVIAVFGLLAKYSLSSSSSKPSTTLDDNTCYGDCACNEVPSPKSVLAILMSPEQSIEQLFEDDPLADTYTPYIMLQFHDNGSHVRSNVRNLQDASAPDDFAALFDAPQDALPSVLLKDFRSSITFFARFVVIWIAVALCFILRAMGFFVTGRFGRRGIKRLLKELRDARLSDSTLMVDEITDDDQTASQQVVGTSDLSTCVPFTTYDQTDNIRCEAYEEMIMRWIISQMSQPFLPSGNTVETLLLGEGGNNTVSRPAGTGNRSRRGRGHRGRRS